MQAPAGVWDPAAKNNKFCERIANGRLCSLCSGAGWRYQILQKQSTMQLALPLRGGIRSCKTKKFCEGIARRRLAMSANIAMFPACRRRRAAGTRLR